MPDKATAQFLVTILSVLGMAITTILSVVIDAWHHRDPSPLTMLMAGGLISLSSSTASWLFRSTPAAADDTGQVVLRR